MVMTSVWLDKKRPDAGLTPRDTTVTGAFVEDTGFGVARVQIPHDDPDNVVNVPAAPGVYAPGALVTVTLSSRGVPLGMTPPLRLPADVPLVGVGDEGAQTLTDRTVLAETTARLDDLGSEIIDSGQTLAERLATIGASADGKTRTTPALTPPAGDSEQVGDLWIQFADETLAAIVGTWTWSGTQWLPSELGHEVIGSVDIGSLTVVGQARLTAAVIETLWADVVRSRKLTTDMLQVGSGDNLLPNPGFEDGGAGWELQTGVTTSPDAGKNGTGALAIPASSSQVGAYYAVHLPALRPRIVPGKPYRVSAWVRSTTEIAMRRASVYVRWYDETLGATWLSMVNVSNAAAIPAGTWGLVEGILTAPEGATRAVLGLYKQAAHTAELTWSTPALTPATDASLLVDGAILARALAADAIDGKVITGATVRTGATGARVVLDATALSVFGADGSLVATYGPLTTAGVSNGAGLLIQQPKSGEDIFVAKYDSTGAPFVLVGQASKPVERLQAWADSITLISGKAGGELRLESTNATAFLRGKAVAVQALAGNATVQATGQVQIKSTAKQVFIDHGTAPAAANCHITDVGLIYRSTSALRYKQDIEDLVIDVDKVLALRPRTWRDRGEVERDPGVTARYVGFVAEELIDLGLEQFVVYDSAGDVDAIAYDRLTAALLPVVQSQQRQIDGQAASLTALMARLDALEAAR